VLDGFALVIEPKNGDAAFRDMVPHDDLWFAVDGRALAEQCAGRLPRHSLIKNGFRHSLELNMFSRIVARHGVQSTR
jgi:hypothetical protein